MIYICICKAARGSYRQGDPASKSTYIIYAKGPIQACRETLKTRVHSDREPLQKVVHAKKWALQIRGPPDKVTLTYKMPLQTMWPYRQGPLTYKDFIQTRGLYSK